LQAFLNIEPKYVFAIGPTMLSAKRGSIATL
jgi:hypothetical protein